MSKRRKRKVQEVELVGTKGERVIVRLHGRERCELCGRRVTPDSFRGGHGPIIVGGERTPVFVCTDHMRDPGSEQWSKNIRRIAARVLARLNR